MNEQKPVYLFASGRPRDSRTPDPLIQAVLRESGKKSPSIAYSGTASGDDENFFKRISEPFREAGASRVFHAVITSENADINKAKDILVNADIIFISGGDVDRGIRVLREKNMIEFLNGLYKEGKLFFGASAGAIMLAKEWVRWPDPDDSSSAELFPCLDFAPVICDCHDEESGWEELKAALMLEQNNTVGYGLASGTAIKVFPDGTPEALGSAVHRYIRHNDSVERISDLLPAGI
ncbi:Type 1 glutamine amidotransferase-like domain-containing protein [Chloroflexota bacterium]